MKKLFLLPLLFAAVLVVWNTACTKDSQTDPNTVDQRITGAVEDRTLQPYNPCGNRQTVIWYHLATLGNIATQNFQSGWKAYELDRIANDCVLGDALPGDCVNSGTQVFQGLPQFNVNNFMDANGYVTPQKQDQIIAMALAWATSHISACGEGYSPVVYQIDFMIPQHAPYTIDFAVRYCCHASGTGTGNG